MDEERDKLSIATAKLYYESNYSQQEICDKLGISRPTVSRLLQYAKDKGFVRIEVVNPFEDVTHLADAIKRKFGLKKVFVTFAPVDKYSEIIKSITTTAADYLDELVDDGDIIGVSWGVTLNALASKLNKKKLDNVKVVQLKGGMSHSKTQTHAIETVNLFAQAYRAEANYNHLPVIFDNIKVKKIVEKERHVKSNMSLIKNANIIIFTVGSVSEDSLLFKLGYFTKSEKQKLMEHASADVCSRFIDHNGEICDININNRTVGIELDDLKQKPNRILIAGGHHKVEAIKATLRGDYANILFIDRYTAVDLLKL